MDLLMTGWVEQDPIVKGIRPTINPVNQVMIFPAGFFGYFSLTNGAVAVLGAPQV
jgi:hypothetical protein